MTIQAQFEYRPDIDGLRAVAVMSVVLFHAFPHQVTGGFVGVDVFFVISGFLITSLILREMQAGNFSLTHFYARRVKRIFPSLGLILLFGLVAGWVCLNFLEYKQLATHAALSAIFISNFQFIKEAGYFDNAADTKPLLHLWSLAIEEQFYIFWPLVLLLFKRIPRWSFLSLIALFFASFSYSMYLVFRGSMVLDFYSPLSRFWELILGSGLAFLLFRHPHVAKSWRPSASWAGCFLILGSVLFFNDHLPFPGYWALIPTIGAALLIFGGMSTYLNATVLASRPMVAIGLISFPLYLWHWPLLSFARILNAETPSLDVRIMLVACSMVLAWLSFRFVERPVRFGNTFPRAVIWLSLGMVAIVLIGHAINRFDGFKFRHHGRMNADPATLVVGAERGSLRPTCTASAADMHLFEWCFTDGKHDPPAFAVLGDSKGEALIYSLIKESTPNQSWFMLGPINFLADPNSDVVKAAEHAIDSNSALKVIVLSNALRGIFTLDTETGWLKTSPTDAEINDKVDRYSRVISKWHKAGIAVVFVIDNPTLPDPSSCISGALTPIDSLNSVLYRKQNPRCTIRYTDHLKGTAAYQQFIIKLKERNPSLLVYDPLPMLCDVAANRCDVAKDGAYLYSYGDHISDSAGRLIAKDLIPLIGNLVK
jgi:peptidoglycan/LPS O-acetylase OafA/YrhL